jgi:hypothetical protein
MTLEQATQLKADLNEQLAQSGNTNLTYSVYTFWTPAAEKDYNVILYPLVYKAKFEAADTSGQFSVVRVSFIAQLAGAQTDEGFINSFNAAVAKDPEANNTLNK